MFAVALLASGQNSTITGTLTGQVIMEGFIHMRMPMWARRLVTRLLSVVPVLICVSMTRGQTLKAQHEAINNLIIKCLGWFSVIALTYLNLIGLPDQIANFIPHNLGLSHLISGFLILGVLFLLIWTIVELYRGNKKMMAC